MVPNKVIIHCSATKNKEECDISTIDKWHRERGWEMCGYHYVIQPDGRVQRGRPESKVGAHCEGANKDSIGICLIGTDKYTKDQFLSLRGLIEEICLRYKIPVTEIYMHHEFESAKKQGKTCPNIRAADYVISYVWNNYKYLEKYMEA